MKLEIEDLKIINETLNNLNSYLGENLSQMSRTIDEICSNVQSKELTEVNSKYSAAIAQISGKLKNDLPKIVEFINKQIALYEQSGESAQKSINDLASNIADMLS